MKKKITAIVLCLSMLLSLLPVPVYAAEPEAQVTEALEEYEELGSTGKKEAFALVAEEMMNAVREYDTTNKALFEELQNVIYAAIRDAETDLIAKAYGAIGMTMIHVLQWRSDEIGIYRVFGKIFGYEHPDYVYDDVIVPVQEMMKTYIIDKGYSEEAVTAICNFYVELAAAYSAGYHEVRQNHMVGTDGHFDGSDGISKSLFARYLDLIAGTENESQFVAYTKLCGLYTHMAGRVGGERGYSDVPEERDTEDGVYYLVEKAYNSAMDLLNSYRDQPSKFSTMADIYSFVVLNSFSRAEDDISYEVLIQVTEVMKLVRDGFDEISDENLPAVAILAKSLAVQTSCYSGARYLLNECKEFRELMAELYTEMVNAVTLAEGAEEKLLTAIAAGFPKGSDRLLSQATNGCSLNIHVKENINGYYAGLNSLDIDPLLPLGIYVDTCNYLDMVIPVHETQKLVEENLEAAVLEWETANEREADEDTKNTLRQELYNTFYDDTESYVYNNLGQYIPALKESALTTFELILESISGLDYDAAVAALDVLRILYQVPGVTTEDEVYASAIVALSNITSVESEKYTAVSRIETAVLDKVCCMNNDSPDYGFYSEADLKARTAFIDTCKNILLYPNNASGAAISSLVMEGPRLTYIDADNIDETSGYFQKFAMHMITMEDSDKCLALAKLLLKVLHKYYSASSSELGWEGFLEIADAFYDKIAESADGGDALAVAMLGCSILEPIDYSDVEYESLMTEVFDALNHLDGEKSAALAIMLADFLPHQDAEGNQGICELIDLFEDMIFKADSALAERLGMAGYRAMKNLKRVYFDSPDEEAVYLSAVREELLLIAPALGCETVTVDLETLTENTYIPGASVTGASDILYLDLNSGKFVINGTLNEDGSNDNGLLVRIYNHAEIAGGAAENIEVFQNAPEIPAQGLSAGVISGGSFGTLEKLENYSEISGGTFTGAVQNAEAHAVISGGIFEGDVVHDAGMITAGSFKGAVSGFGTISGGRFVNSLYEFMIAEGYECMAKADGEYNYKVIPEREPLTLTVEAEDMTFTGSPYDESSIQVSAVKEDETPVTDATYTYTWYKADDTDLSDALEEAPSSVGAYKLLVSVDPEDECYLGTAEAVTIKILSAPVDDSHKPTSGKYSYRKKSGKSVIFISSAENGDFRRFTVKKGGGEPEELTEDTHYKRSSGSIVIELDPLYVESLEPGTYEFSIVSALPHTDPEETVSADFTLQVSAGCEATVTSAPKAGTGLTLLLGGAEAGTFDIIKSSKGFLLYDAEQKLYVGFNDSDKGIEMTDIPYTWSYDGGLYASVTKTKTTRVLWWSRTTRSTEKYYLTYAGDAFTLSGKCVKAEVSETKTYEDHDPVYSDNGDGTHSAYCSRCGELLVEDEEHAGHYDDETHLCSCGKYDPDWQSIEVTATYGTTVTRRSGGRFFGGGKKTTTYTAKVKLCVMGCEVKKVEVAGSENGPWTKSYSYSSSSPIEKFYVRVTTGDGAQHLFLVMDGIGYPAN